MKLIEREVLTVSGAKGIDRKAIEGVVLEVAFVYSGTTNSSTNSRVFEQVDSYRKGIALNTASATNVSFPVANQSKDSSGSNTGQYVSPAVAGDVALEVDGGNVNQVTKAYLWILK